MSTLQTYALHGPTLLDPRWFNGVRYGQHAATVNPDGTLIVDGETLRFGEQVAPPGTAVKVWLNSAGFFVCATDLALHEQELAQEEAAQAEKVARDRALDALRADAEAFNARLKLPVRWDVGIKDVLSGLSETSMGHGRSKATVEHIYLLEPLKNGRLVRQAGDLLCTSGSGSNGKRWSDKIVERLHDSCGTPFAPKVSCKSCLSLANRWIVDPESTITPSDQSMTTTQSSANELDEEITHALTELGEDVSVERIEAIRSRISDNLLIGEDRAAAVMIAVRMARAALDSGTHQAAFRSDIPSESWLETKIRYAIEDGRNQWGVPRTMGPITGSFSRDLLLPVDLLATIPGERGEQNDVRPASLAWLRNNLAKEIRSSVYIEIDPFGKAWVNEGNHRIMMAVEKKLSALPVHVRYFSGGERLADLSPAHLLELDAQLHVGRTALTQDAQPAAAAKDAPLRCTLDEFLCGADGADAYTEQHFDDYIRDIDTSFPPDDVEIVAYTEDDEDGPYGIVASSDSVLLVHRAPDASTWSGAEVVGYYNTPGAVCIQDEHQGHGLGAELILWTALHWSGGPPTDGLDEQCFSEAGYAAHVAAWNLGVKRGLIIDREPELTGGLDCAP